MRLKGIIYHIDGKFVSVLVLIGQKKRALKAPFFSLFCNYQFFYVPQAISMYMDGIVAGRQVLVKLY